MPLCRPVLALALVAGVFASAGVAPAGRDDAPQSSFSENAEVLAVELPVTVTVGDKPVRGLKAENFEVLSGKDRQPIVGFEVVDLDAVEVTAADPAAPPAAAPAALAVARRHVLLLFDLGYTQPVALERARAAARLALERSLRPSDLVGVATYDPTDGAHLLLGFTADRELAARALDNIGSSKLIEHSGDPLRLTLALWDRDMTTMGNPPAASTRSGAGGEAVAEAKQAIKEELYDRVQQSARAAERSTRDAERDRVDAMTRSYADLARLLGTIPGRKSIFLLSEGFDSGLMLGKEESRHDREAVEAGEVWKVDSDKKYGSSTTQGMLGQMLEEFRRAGCVIEAIDVGGLRANADVQVEQVGSQQVGGDMALSNAGQDSLFVMANETGGDLFRNSNDLGGALHAALAKSSVTYVITLAPNGVRPDGSYHPLTVRLKNGPRGARVAARTGFYAPRPYAQRTSAERGMEAAGLIVAGEEGGRLGAALLALPLSAAKGAAARVPVWLEVDGETLMREQTGGDRLNVEVYFYALDKSGRVRDHLAQTLGLDLGKLGQSLWDRGLKIYAELALPAGSYTLRALVRNGATGASALRVAALTVRESAGEPQLLAPVVPEPLNKWLNVPANRAGAVAVAYPFVVGSRPVMPAAQPVLVSGAEVPLCVFAYGVGEGGKLRVHLHGHGGEDREVPAELVDRAAAGAGLERLLLRLRPADFANGDYTLSVELDTPGGTIRSASVPVAVMHRDAPAGAAP